jgi:hypothetical protein
MAVRRWFVPAAAVCAPPLVSALALPLRTVVPQATLAAALLGVVAVVGACGTRPSTLVAAISAALAFDLLWVEPYGSLQVRAPSDRLTGVVLLGVGIGLAELLGRRRRISRPARIDRGRRQVASDHLLTIGRVAEDIAEGDPADFVLLDVARSLVELFGLTDCRYEVAPFECNSMAVLVRGGELEQQGVRWDPKLIGLPRSGFAVPIVARGHTAGRFVCLPRRESKPSVERLAVAQTLADQAASALLLAVA